MLALAAELAPIKAAATTVFTKAFIVLNLVALIELWRSERDPLWSPEPPQRNLQ
jgi:hypothetical protein